MADEPEGFYGTARGLARNPLGIIALFIVLVYALASTVTILADSIRPAERVPLIWFLIAFPVLVLAVFTYLVTHHAEKLYGPGDFKDEANYVRLIEAASSLAAASAAKGGPPDGGADDVADVVLAVRAAAPVSARARRSHRLRGLWVDDNPDNNRHERRAFEAVGLAFTLAGSTTEALALLEKDRFDVIISDMGRKEGPREGYVLLDALRKAGNTTPFFIYAASNLPEHKAETARHGGDGTTNQPRELFEMVTKALARAT